MFSILKLQINLHIHLQPSPNLYWKCRRGTSDTRTAILEKPTRFSDIPAKGQESGHDSTACDGGRHNIATSLIPERLINTVLFGKITQEKLS